MSKKKLVVYGAGDNGGLVALKMRGGDLWRDYDFTGFVDDHKTGKYAGFPIVGSREDFPRLKGEGVEAVVVTLLEDPIARLEACLELEDMGFDFPSVYTGSTREGINIGNGVGVHNSAVLLGVDHRIGDFSVVGPFVTIEGRTELGKGVILSPYTFVGYGSKIGDASVVYPRGSVMPNVKIGKNCVVGHHVLQNKHLSDGEKRQRH